MKKFILAIILFNLFATSAIAQRTCASHEHYLQMLQTDPDFAAKRKSIEEDTKSLEANPPKQTRVVKTIPVVVHIVYNTASQNITDSQVVSQINVLNADFRKLNADWTLTPTAFQSVVADCEIEFCLAKQDPNGIATTGITRTSTTITSFIDDDKIKYTAQGGRDAWNSTKYLNIWVGKLGGGLLGYAQFPGGPVASDGVVINFTAFGTIVTPSLSTVYNKGRTATHEVGHWLNLFHIWGDDGTSCASSDLVNDTPNQADENYGCPTFPAISCTNGPNGDMWMNYMDYTNDACMYMFTAGQKTRISSLFNTGGARVSLLTSIGCVAIVTCSVPSSLTTAAITNTGATLNWASVATATSYNIQYKVSTASTWTTTTASTNSKILTGLAANTSYQFQVQAVCNSGTSAYSTIANFATLANTAPNCSNNFEINNTRGTATSISINSSIISMISTSGDKDYYKIATTNAAPKLKVTLTNLPLDYDLKLYSAAGTLLGSSQNIGVATESVTYNNATTGATYVVYVFGYNGANNSTQCYTLSTSSSASNLKMEEASTANKSELEVFPNPASDKLGIRFFASENKAININIYNTLGQRIIHENHESFEGENNIYLDLKNQTNGVYILEMIQDDEKEIKQFSIIR